MTRDSRRSRAEQGATTRERILEAARRGFSERGFESATIAEIAAAAGVTHGGVYAHFANKQALLLAVVSPATLIPQFPAHTSLEDVIDQFLVERAGWRPETKVGLDAAMLRAVRTDQSALRTVAKEMARSREVLAGLVTVDEGRLGADEAGIFIAGLARGLRATSPYVRNPISDAAVRVAATLLQGREAHLPSAGPPTERPVVLEWLREGPFPDRTSRDRARLQTRAALLDATERVLVDSGLAHVTVARVAKAAGFTTGAVYSSFPDKEALLAAVHARWVRRGMCDLAPGKGKSARQDLDLVVRSYSRLDPREAALQVELGLLRIHYPTLGARHGAVIAARRLALAQLINSAAAESGVTPPLPPLWLAESLLATRDGVWVQWYLDRRQVSAKLVGKGMQLLLGPQLSER